MQLRSKAIQLKHLHNIQLIVIDYLQLMGNVDKSKGNQNREQEVAQISSGIRALSKELDIPIIALAQLNRTSLGRFDKRPQLSDLRESGAIEQDADIVAFIHRPEKYGFIEDEEGNSLKGVAEIIFAKNRDGDNDIEQIQFTGNTLSFTDFAEELPNPDEFTQPQIKNEAPF